MAEKANAKAKPAPKGGKASGGKGKKGGKNLFSWFLLAVLAGGLAWVVWPFFSPLPNAVPAPKQAAQQTTQQLRQIAGQNPDAEVFNPEGKELGADAVKKK
ncbi:hypothetical protein SAMN05444156_2619 [Verrucomicrobium sp. GAS474]|uniref:hypothetical protein n=1 Tax=Verrucomicrobium sp. GAS474 TaxID=1882831 RepID=UPI000879510D|nr:hypothetical protein [Verrucomicrobium sp. GAS474]SDU20956.1 hypothetical protein SAMN05444156_2619 [Verrucomicrobium sp. GAS474]